MSISSEKKRGAKQASRFFLALLEQVFQRYHILENTTILIVSKSVCGNKHRMNRLTDSTWLFGMLVPSTLNIFYDPSSS